MALNVVPNEDGYNAERPDQVVFSYFKEEPWVDNNGVDYVGETTYKSMALPEDINSVSTGIWTG
jgi:hypothetical protein